MKDHDAEKYADIKFLALLGDGEFDEIIVYGTLCECKEDLDNMTENQ
jgi:pyruvate dehydrogenase complex dehydrogenase (E1) component